MFADYHVHSYYSNDSQCPMEAMLEQAIAIGLDELAFTDHVDYGVKTIAECDYEAYFAELAGLREKYEGKLNIRAGIEFGMQLQTMSRYHQDFNDYPFDFVLLSSHQIDGKEFWDNEYQEGKTQAEFHNAYYEEIYKQVCQYKDYSVLGHLDVIKRYDRQGNYPDALILPAVEKVLCQVIADGKGIELNTSCFHYGLPDLTPSRAILELYHRLGGKVITIGSDAHNTSRLGEKIGYAKQVLADIGFRQFCTFEKMKAIYWDL
jgi:histidinol-phosphatase (PHP family)